MTGVSTDEAAARVGLEAWLVTDIGMVRDHNEDSAFMSPEAGFFIVADGMGGHAAGEVASAMAVESVKNTLEAARSEIAAFRKAPSDAGRRGLVQLLQNAVLAAHQAVYQRGQTEADKAGMGTTLDVALVAGPEAFVAHVGDSRTYLIRDGRASQITTDHTVAEVLVIEGKLTIEEAQVSPLRTILVNAIGVSPDVGVEMAHVTLRRGDRLLLCSDGLHDYFPVEEEISQRLSGEKPGEALAEMVELAKTRGGHDNITGVAVNVAELVDAVPSHMGEESTQPVDLVASTFGADEPTQTAFHPPGLGDMRETQPMRAVTDERATAATIPPPVAEAKAEAKPGAKAKSADAVDSTQPIPTDEDDAADDEPTEARAAAVGDGDGNGADTAKASEAEAEKAEQPPPAEPAEAESAEKKD